MKILIALLLVFVVLYLYRQANIKRGRLRTQARQQYSDIATSINYWAERKDDPERFQLAQVALALYDDWHRRSIAIPVTMRNTSAEEFEVLTEWRSLIEDHERKSKDAWNLKPSYLLELEFAGNRAALREYCGTLEAKI
jgi:hypothetical protein